MTWRCMLAGAVTLALAGTPGPAARAQQPVTLTVKVDQPGPRIDPIFYGLMTEEINFSYDGGLYAELIRNRTFRDDPTNPVNWSVVKDAGSDGAIALDQSPVPNTALTTALKLDATAVSAKRTRRRGERRLLGHPRQAGHDLPGVVLGEGQQQHQRTADRVDREQRRMARSGRRRACGRSGGVEEVHRDLKTGKLTPSITNRFVISTSHPGTTWLSLVSLFPPTYKNRPNGNRADLMELLAGDEAELSALPRRKLSRRAQLSRTASTGRRPSVRSNSAPRT